MKDVRQSLGPCCCCGEHKNVRTVVMLSLRAPEPGKGWGCVVCGLPMDGVCYVVCDRCLEQESRPREVVVGYPGEGKRLAIDKLSDEPFEHDMSLHKMEDSRWD